MAKIIIIEAFTYIPNIKDLNCIIYESFPSKSQSSSLFHCIYVCRLILSEIPDILVAPNNTNNTIYIISANIDQDVEKIKSVPYLTETLRFLGFEEVTSNIYDMCLAYSLITRVSPEWIKMDKYLVQSQDFVQYKELINGVKVNIIRHSEKVLLLELSAVMIKVSPYFEPKTCIPRCWKEYTENKNGFINIILSQQVYILPNMRKGKVISICKSLNGNSVREDWLNQYGYLLPNENELSYCKVKYLNFEYDCMIYPSVCLLSKPLYITENNCRKTISRFLKVFIRNNPTICGNIMELFGKQELQNQTAKSISSYSCIKTKGNMRDKCDKYEWEECSECSEVELSAQTYNPIVTIPFDFDSVKSLQYLTSITKK